MTTRARGRNPLDRPLAALLFAFAALVALPGCASSRQNNNTAAQRELPQVLLGSDAAREREATQRADRLGQTPQPVSHSRY